MNNIKTSELIQREMQDLCTRVCVGPLNSFHLAYQEEGMAVARIRLSEKLRQFKELSRLTKRSTAEDRVVREALLDLAGSAIMAAMELDRANEDSKGAAPASANASDTASASKKTQPGKVPTKQVSPSNVQKEKPPVYAVSPYRASKIIETRKPLGLFITKEGDLYVGIDNRTGDAWTEDFDCFGKCLAWLVAYGEIA